MDDYDFIGGGSQELGQELEDGSWKIEAGR
jgi:hypothetical protein